MAADPKSVLRMFGNGISDSGTDLSMDSLLTEESRMNFWIYRNNYFAGHAERLIQIYQTIVGVIGIKNTKYLARKFIETHPPDSPNLDDFGKKFAKFLTKSTEVKDIRFLPYLAEIDWYWYMPQGEIEVPERCLELWGSIKKGEYSNHMVINEDSKERIHILSVGDEHRLVAN